jgi:hypothetical protein
MPKRGQTKKGGGGNGLNGRLRSNVKNSGVGGGKMVRDTGRMGALKSTLKNAKKVIRKMKG